MMYIGGRIGIYGGDINKIVDDIQALRPTIVSFVPRLLNKLYERINSTVQQGNFLKRLLFKTALKVSDFYRSFDVSKLVYVFEDFSGSTKPILIVLGLDLGLGVIRLLRNPAF
jgi:long-subunit acyl-CoA synthetase (AMP-forming)